MKRRILNLVLCLSSISMFSQTLKTYTGKYSEIDNQGVAVYQYYENDDYERIYHGNFKFTLGNNNHVLRGTFKQNLKEGLWQYKSENESLSGQFINGRPEGEWIHTVKDYFKNKNVEAARVTFNNGVLVGDFHYNYKVNGGNCGLITTAKINGKINENGYLDGSWKLKWDSQNIEDLRKYMNGVLYFRLIRDLQTGKIIYKVDRTEFVKNIFQHMKDSTAEYGGKTYVIMDSSSDEFKNNAVYREPKDENYSSNDSYYIRYDHIMYACNNWYGRFFEFTKGEIECKNKYQRIIIDYNNTEEGRSKILAEIDKKNALEREEQRKKQELIRAKEEQQRAEQQRILAEEKERLNAMKSKFYELKEENEKTHNYIDYQLYMKRSLINNLPKRKKHILFNAYASIYNEQYKLTFSDENYRYIERVHALQKKMEALVNENTKELEKKLDGVNDIEKIFEIFDIN